MRKQKLRKRPYGRWVCKLDRYEAHNTLDRERHYREKHPEVDFDPRYMARFWDYPEGVKPKRAKTLCTRCGKEIPVGERTEHLEHEHPGAFALGLTFLATGRVP